MRRPETPVSGPTHCWRRGLSDTGNLCELVGHSSANDPQRLPWDNVRQQPLGECDSDLDDEQSGE
jgi:hypothetical protein